MRVRRDPAGRGLDATSLIAVTLVVLAIVAGYAHTLGYPLSMDDLTALSENPTLGRLEDLGAIWAFHPARFLVDWSFAVNVALTRLEPVGMRATNVVIHLAVSLVVGWIARELARRLETPGRRFATSANLTGVIAALVFAAHPLATQSVTSVVQRATSLAALFELGAVAFYLEARRRGRDLEPWAWSWICAVLTAFTKELAVGLPLAIGLIEWRLRRTATVRDPEPSPVLFIPYLAIVPLVAIVAQLPATHDWSQDVRHPVAGYLLTQLAVIPRYLGLAVWPHGQNLDPDIHLHLGLDGGVVFGLAVIAAALGLAFVGRQRWPLAALGVGWFFVMLLPESSVFPITDLMNEQRAYIPLVGIAWAAASLLATLVATRSWGGWVVVALIATLAVVTHVRNRVWRDHVSLWEDVARKSPAKPRALNNYGLALQESGLHEKAKEAFRRAIAADSSYVNARLSLASLYRVEGQYEEAVRLLEATTAVAPNDWRVEHNLGVAYRWAGDTASAIRAYERAVTLAPGRPDPAGNLETLRRAWRPR